MAVGTKWRMSSSTATSSATTNTKSSVKVLPPHVFPPTKLFIVNHRVQVCLWCITNHLQKMVWQIRSHSTPLHFECVYTCNSDVEWCSNAVRSQITPFNASSERGLWNHYQWTATASCSVSINIWAKHLRYTLNEHQHWEWCKLLSFNVCLKNKELRSCLLWCLFGSWWAECIFSALCSLHTRLCVDVFSPLLLQRSNRCPILHRC